jgi:alpha-L-rhamnosidase
MQMRSARFSFPVCVLAIVGVAHAQSGEVNFKPWHAQWITDANAPQRDEAVLHFRKTIEIRQVPAHFAIHVSADNQFLLYVNQHRVGTGPSRSDLAHWRYETYDLAPFLKSGQNILAATVWNFGTHSAFAQMSDRIGFLVQGAGAVESGADTGPSWEVEQETGIKTLPPQVPGYYAAEPGERLDASAFDWRWDSASSRGSSWKAATPLSLVNQRGATDSHNNWELVADPLPMMEFTEEAEGRVVRTAGINSAGGFPDTAFTVPPHAKAAILLDNGELTTAYPELAVRGGAGTSIRLTYAEALVGDKGQKGNRNEIAGKHIVGVRDEFLPGGGDCEFVPLTWRTWRYLQLDIETADQPLTIQRFRAWFTAYPFPERAHFHSNDKTLSQIWDVGWRTARLDAHDTYMDTPYWERLQYTGDTRIQALISYTVAGDDRLARQAINAYNYSRVPDGLTQSRYPSSLRQMIPTFSLLWIGMVHDFWMYRGDAKFVREQLPGVRSVLAWYMQRLRPDGLLGKVAWWPFVDWGKDFDFGMPPEDTDGESAIITLQLVEALRYAADLETALGDSTAVEKYRNMATRAAAAVYAKCWNKHYGLLGDTPEQKHFSQHANILGVWLDVIPRTQQENVLRRILSTTDAGFTSATPVPPMTAATYYFRFYLARAIDHAGMGDEYLKLLGPWKTMLSLGLTTWAESPEPTRSDSHAWSAHPDYDFLTIVAGIRPASPGVKSVVIEPHLGNLKHVDAVMPTPQGTIQVEYQRTSNGLEARVTLPQGTKGELRWKGRMIPLPAHPAKLIVPVK